MPRTRALAVIALLIVAMLGGCSSSGSSSAGGSGSCTTVSGSFTIVGKDISWQDTSGKKVTCLQAKSGETVTFTVDNRDTVQHNLHIQGNGFNQKTQLQTGPVKQTLKIKAPKAGTYTFVCDIHANMEGSFKVK